MGLIFSRFYKHIFQSKNRRILMLGLDAAGKTSILYQLGKGNIKTSIPTIGLNIESLESRRFSIVSWDVGGAPESYTLPFRFVNPEEINGLIFVIDSNDHERVECVKSEMQDLLRKEFFIGLPLLIIANKQDLPNALGLDELTEHLELSAICDRKWHIQGTCACNKEGLNDAFRWIEQSIDESKKF